MAFKLNYDEAVHLDAEDLAEGGIAAAYESLLPKLLKFVRNPVTIEEFIDADAPCYSVRCGESEFEIFGPDGDEVAGHSWGRAAVALFAIVNEQLQDSTHRLYAINGGNELCGIFLTQTESLDAQNSLPNKRDWPYLPRDEHPWYGQCH